VASQSLPTLISSGSRTVPSPLLERLPRASGGTSCSHAFPLTPLDLRSPVALPSCRLMQDMAPDDRPANQDGGRGLREETHQRGMGPLGVVGGGPLPRLRPLPAPPAPDVPCDGALDTDGDVSLQRSTAVLSGMVQCSARHSTDFLWHIDTVIRLSAGSKASVRCRSQHLLPLDSAETREVSDADLTRRWPRVTKVPMPPCAASSSGSGSGSRSTTKVPLTVGPDQLHVDP
jgi:hypothetical protein